MRGILHRQQCLPVGASHAEEDEGADVSKAFRGSISTDIRDSVPDWAPFEPPKAPDGAPNVV